MIDIAHLKPIKLIIFDVDGIFTDGRIYLSDQGDEIRSFHLHDGLGIKLLLKAGIEVGIISAKNSPAVRRRMESLGIKHLYLGYEEKQSAYQDLLNKLALEPMHVAYMGDDLPDLALIQKSAVGITVKNGHHTVKAHADWITKAKGGKAAVREVCDLILEAQEI